MATLLPFLASPLLASIPRPSELAFACTLGAEKPLFRGCPSGDETQPQEKSGVDCEIASCDFVSSYDYNYDRNGNRAQQIELNGATPETTTYDYDDADRLTQVAYPDKTVDYTLDGVGNRTNEVTTDTATSTVTSSKLFVYNDRDWLTSIADSANAANDATYAYDLNGNQVART
ncbi:MAG: hypothetical protein ACREQZ_04205, partial [Woeseiaceae bacterium]